MNILKLDIVDLYIKKNLNELFVMNKKNILRFHMVSILLLNSIFFPLNADNPHIAKSKTKIKDFKLLISHISNKDVKWEIRGDMLTPSIVHSEICKLLVKERNIGSIPFLLKALKDDDKFIVAHVILTKMLLSSMWLGIDNWNHLNLKNARKKPKEEKKKIIKLWNEFPLSKIKPFKTNVF